MEECIICEFQNFLLQAILTFYLLYILCCYLYQEENVVFQYLL